MTTSTLRAVLWDMDGTLINTEPLWGIAIRELAASYGAPWTRVDAYGSAGQPLPATAKILRARGVDLGNREVIDALSQRVAEQLDGHRPGSGALPWMPGALELLTDITRAGLPVALVTNAFSDLARKVVAAVPGTPFTVVGILQEQLEAANRLGVAPAECVALEDSETGTRAAEAAGIRTLTIPGLSGVPVGAARSRVRSLEGISLADLQAICAGKTINNLD